ncbi:18122_t:CDS:2, partial [Racocetra persica]
TRKVSMDRDYARRFDGEVRQRVDEKDLNAGINCYPLCQTLDQTLGNIIVLSQCGWPYWRDRMFRPVVIPLIKKCGGLIYPDLLRFVN